MKINIGNYPGPHSKRPRRVSVQIDKWDTWNADHTLALIILPVLKQLKETKHGIPCSMLESRDWDTTDEDMIVGQANWDRVMDKMIWSFQEIANDDFFEKYPEYDLVIYRAHYAKIQEGLKLFAEHFQSLWD